jgi:hypothetical protein
VLPLLEEGEKKADFLEEMTETAAGEPKMTKTKTLVATIHAVLAHVRTLCREGTSSMWVYL